MTLAAVLIVLALLQLVGALGARFILDGGLTFDTADRYWWKPEAHVWHFTALTISETYGVRVGLLGLKLQLCAEILLRDREADEIDDVDDLGE